MNMLKLKSFFTSGKTLPLEYRLRALNKFRKTILANEEAVYAALKDDLGKSRNEAYITELGIVLSELNQVLGNLDKWAGPVKVNSRLMFFPSKSHIIYEPYGTVFILSPWNYPLMLSLCPLIGAVAAGNCALVRPSSQVPATGRLIQRLISESFEDGHVQCLCGANSEVSAYIREGFDYIFFTGSARVGREIMQQAADRLTPLTLELGGKSPVIVHKDADIKMTAKRLAWGKTVNAGQTCVAPDYLFVHESVKEKLVEALGREWSAMWGDALNNPDYVHIVSEAHFERLTAYIKASEVIYGGNSDSLTRRIEPTVLEKPDFTSLVMTEEIFGPILPVFSYSDIATVTDFIRSRPKPLALYLFTGDAELAKHFELNLPFGGGCINDVMLHVGHPELPFGGVGSSGMGKYHGFYSFETFSNRKSILRRGTWIEFPFRFPPYTDRIFRWLKRMIK